MKLLIAFLNSLIRIFLSESIAPIQIAAVLTLWNLRSLRHRIGGHPLTEKDVLDFLSDFPGWQYARTIAEALAADLETTQTLCDTMTRQGKLAKSHSKAAYRLPKLKEILRNAEGKK